MIYRCRSCGSNATVGLSCDYCGSGTRRRRKTKPAQHKPAAPFWLVAGTGVFAGICLWLLVGGAA